MTKYVALASDLRRHIGGDVTLGADLRCYSRWRAGGRAAVVVEPSTAEDVSAALTFLAEREIPKLVIGDGSNILFDDRGYEGVIIRIGRRLSRTKFESGGVRAQAGIWVPHFVRLLGQRGLRGLEHAIGIPGTLGGLVIMNGGSRRRGVGQNIVSVRGCDLNGQPFERSRAACEFRYRSSTLQDDSLVVLEADLEFETGDPDALRRDMIAIMTERRNKFPKQLPNCGSVFLSDPAMYHVVGAPGSAIERVGLKGYRLGDAQISPLHANFIVNLGSASSDDILALIHLMRTRVHDQTGFWMNAEVRHVSPDGRVRPAHLAAAEEASRLADRLSERGERSAC